MLANYIKKMKLDKRDLLEEKKHFYVNVESLLEDSDLKSNWPDLSDIFEEKCEFICGLLGLSMHHIMSSSHDTTDGDNSQIFPIVQARLETSNHLIMLKDLKSHYYQRFVSIQGGHTFMVQYEKFQMLHIVHNNNQSMFRNRCQSINNDSAQHVAHVAVWRVSFGASNPSTGGKTKDPDQMFQGMQKSKKFHSPEIQ